MEPPLYLWSVFDRNVVMRRIPVVATEPARPLHARVAGSIPPWSIYVCRLFKGHAVNNRMLFTVL
jgi:hypothetical protein